MNAHKQVVKGICFISNQIIATCAFDRLVKIWDLLTSKCLFIGAKHTGRINAIAYSQTFSLLASASKD